MSLVTNVSIHKERYTTFQAHTLKDVFVLLANLSEDLRRQTEVLSDNSFGRVLNPFIQQERRILGEATAVENQEEFGSVLTKTLQRVGVTRREIPKIARFKIIDEGSAISVQGRDPNLAYARVSVVDAGNSLCQLT